VNVSRLFGLLVAAAVSTVVVGGCVSSGTQSDHVQNDDVPRAYHRARFLEDRGLEAVDEASDATRKPSQRRERYDDAIQFFKEARQLYEDELLSDQAAPPERRRNVEREIERLDGMIMRTHKAKPL
jgi:hypothetical protein